MTNYFVHPWGLLLLAALPGWYWLSRFGDLRRSAALQKFRGAATPRVQRWWRHLVPAALLLIALAIAEPVRSGQRSQSPQTPDIVFLLDVSRSMNTRDREKSRLDLARSAITAIVNHAADQRFGLVVFSGDASLECPLTNDAGFLRMQLIAVSRNSVTVGGTRVGEAIRFAARTAFDDASRKARELVLISDGGDETNAAIQAAAELEKHGIRLVVAGVGDPATRAYVPAGEGEDLPVFYQGHPVIAPLDAEALQHICQAAKNCAYTDLASGNLERAVDDRSALFAGAGENVTASSVLAVAAALLLAGESAWRRIAK
ncbi:MAG TPA: VWA domain-containing protein [Bryobacteraceae bacterium]|nr:VWA domain-containing protein [Bryobacteraceae bacterium]